MTLFPLLHSGPFAAPLPPSALPWIARVLADDRDGAIACLCEVLPTCPTLATLAVVGDSPWKDGFPASVREMAEQIADTLPQWLLAGLDVEELEDERLDLWSVANRRVRWLVEQFAERAPTEAWLSLFCEGRLWLCLGDARPLAESAPLPPWLRRLEAAMEDPANAEVDSPTGRLYRQRKRRVDSEADLHIAPSSHADFRRWPKTQVLEFVATVERLAQRRARTERLETRFAEAVEQEKLRALKELSYGASHEINNPLANIATRAQTLLRDEDDPDRRRALATINAQAFRAHEMISDMMLFARPPKLNQQSVDLRALVAEVLQELAPLAEPQGTTLQLQSDDHLFAEVDANHLAAAVRAIVQNSLEAIAEGGEVCVRLSETGDEGEKSVLIEVIDDGPGIPDSLRPRIFEPYFSGREAGRGLGLGLSKAWSVVQAHRGTLEVSSEEGAGATFRLRLPHRASAAKKATSPETR